MEVEIQEATSFKLVEKFTKGDYYFMKMYDKKTRALYNFLEPDIDYDRFKEEVNENSGKYYIEDIFKYDDKEYYVLTDEEADNLAKEQIKLIIEDLGVKELNISYDHFVDSDWFDSALEESSTYYIEDLSDEEVIEQAENFNIDIEEYDGDIEGLRNKLVRIYCLQESDSIDWYIDNFGEESFNQVVLEYDLINKEKLADYIIQSDGRGSILASYDGIESVEEVDGTLFYIYKL